MVIVENEYIKNIPLLHVAPKTSSPEKLPLVIFIHGFKSVKERNLHYAYLLAEAGFRVILPEAIYHGQRNQGLDGKEYYLHFWEIVLTTINEINILKEYYIDNGLVDSKRIGVAGTSMGGIAALGALTQYDWIKAAVSLMGMPAYEKFSHWQLEQIEKQGIELTFSEEQINAQLQILRKYDLSMQPNKLEGRPLLFWHGKRDPQVPYELAHQFFDMIKPKYEKTPEKLHFITDEKAGHKVSIDGVNATVQWFKNFLLEGAGQS